MDMIVQTTKQGPVTDLLFTISQDDYDLTKKLIDGVRQKLGISNVLYSDRLAQVSIVGAGMMSNPGWQLPCLGSWLRTALTLR